MALSRRSAQQSRVPGFGLEDHVDRLAAQAPEAQVAQRVVVVVRPASSGDDDDIAEVEKRNASRG